MYLAISRQRYTMPFRLAYRTDDIYISALSKLRESAEILAVRYANQDDIVYVYI